jgi:hypothetical protein
LLELPCFGPHLCIRSRRLGMCSAARTLIFQSALFITSTRAHDDRT